MKLYFYLIIYFYWLNNMNDLKNKKYAVYIYIYIVEALKIKSFYWKNTYKFSEHFLTDELNNWKQTTDKQTTLIIIDKIDLQLCTIDDRRFIYTIALSNTWMHEWNTKGAQINDTVTATALEWCWCVSTCFGCRGWRRLRSSTAKGWDKELVFGV